MHIAVQVYGPGSSVKPCSDVADKIEIEFVVERRVHRIRHAHRFLNVTISPHAAVVAKSAECIERLDDALDKAQDTKLLKTFNPDLSRAPDRGEAARGIVSQLRHLS